MSLSRLEKRVKTGNWKQIAAETAAELQRISDCESRRAELRKQRESWQPWSALRLNPRELDGLRYTRGCLLLLPEKQLPAFTESYAQATRGRGFLEQSAQASAKAGLLLLFPAHNLERVHAAAAEHGGETVTFAFNGTPSALLERWAQEENRLLAEEARAREALTALSEQAEAVELAEELLSSLLLREEAGRLLPESETCFLVRGWVLTEERGALVRLLEEGMRERYAVSFSSVSRRAPGDAPVALKNPKVIRAFELLTEMYSMPAYDEVDPTPVMTPFYLAFFGMMVADVGYGLVLFLATLLARACFKFDRGFRQNLDFFFFLSFPVMLWGVVYGSFFGVSLPFGLLAPASDIIPILLLSIAFGFIHIMTALGIGAYNHLRRGDLPGALENAFSWMGLLLGLALLALSKLVLKNDPLFYLSAGFCGISAVLILLMPMLQSKKHRIKGLLKGIYALYGATGYIGDLVSYSRLMALGVAGGSIAVAFNTIIATLPLPFRVTLGILLALALQGLNLFLSMLGAYVHGIRLQYVEMFGKFYGGGGRKFSPFKAAEKYIYLSAPAGEQSESMEE